MEQEFTIRLTTEEHPGCWGKDCEGKHFINYLVLKTDKTTDYFQEGHPIYNALFNFAKEQPDVFNGMKKIRAEAVKNGEVYMIERMLSDLEIAMMK